MSADTSDLIGASIEATVTVTLGAPKLPLVLPPAEMKAGEVVIADIGIPGDVIDQLEGPIIDLLTRDQMRPLLQPRAPDAHKGDFGRVLVVAGSMGKAGAAVLCAQGAMRAGAGLVTVAAPKSCQLTIAAHTPDYMTEGLDETNEGTVHFSAADAVLGIDVSDLMADDAGQFGFIAHVRKNPAGDVDESARQRKRIDGRFIDDRELPRQMWPM